MSKTEIRIYTNDKGNTVAECEFGKHRFEIEGVRDSFGVIYEGANTKEFMDFVESSDRNYKIASKLMDLLNEL